MKYQITCAHCNTRFLVDGKGGQTIECKCPGCGGTMRLTLPKSEQGGGEPDSDDYQTGYAPPVDNNGNETDNGDDGDGKHSRRGLALGCLLFVVVIAAAVVAFMALNHTTKKPIEDPYEYVEPDTASADTVVEDTMPEEVDTVEVHEEKPKEVAAPVDTASHQAEEATDETDNTDAEATAPAADASTDKPAASDHHKQKDSKSKDKSSKDKSSKSGDQSSSNKEE